MHLLERRVRARRESDRGGSCPHPEGAGANRRTSDRRVAARRKAMVLRRLEPMRLDGVEILKVEGATYVLNEDCFAWMAEIRFGMTRRFVAGAGCLPDAAANPTDSVAAGIRQRLQEWEEVLRRR